MKKIMFLLSIIMLFALTSNVDAKRGGSKGHADTHVSKGAGHHTSGKAHKVKA